MFLTRAYNLICDSALALVYPQACAVCGHSVESRRDGCACAACWDATRVFSDEEVMCWKCGALSRAMTAPEAREQIRCRRCDENAFTAARACGIYEGALRACVLSLKREPHIPQRLVALTIAACKRAPLDQTTRIIPVPLHPKRERSRGFNQAAIIAHQLSRSMRRPLDKVSLIRATNTERHRAGMDAKGRRETVDKAFALRHSRLISGESILLVDDVFTTGSTASSCAAVLMGAGAKEVFVLTIARALDPHLAW